MLTAALATFIKMREVRLLLSSLRVWTETPASSEDIVNVDILNERIEFHIKVHALVRDTNHEWHIPVAVQCNKLIVHFLAHKRVPVGHVDICSSGIVLPVSNTITDSKTLQGGLED
jgi:hypothetical protein